MVDANEEILSMRNLIYAVYVLTGLLDNYYVNYFYAIMILLKITNKNMKKKTSMELGQFIYFYFFLSTKNFYIFKISFSQLPINSKSFFYEITLIKTMVPERAKKRNAM